MFLVTEKIITSIFDLLEKSSKYAHLLCQISYSRPGTAAFSSLIQRVCSSVKPPSAMLNMNLRVILSSSVPTPAATFAFSPSNIFLFSSSWSIGGGISFSFSSCGWKLGDLRIQQKKFVYARKVVIRNSQVTVFSLRIYYKKLVSYFYVLYSQVCISVP